MKDMLPDERVGKEREIELERGGSLATLYHEEPSDGVGHACYTDSGL